MSSGKGGSSGGGGDLPAGGGDALRGLPTFGMEDETGDAARLGRQLQATGGGEIEVVEFAEDAGQAPAAQPFLQRPQAIGRPRRGDDNEPRRIETTGGQSRPIKVELRLAPQNRPGRGEAAKQGGTEAKRGGIARRPCHLMQTAARQAAAEGRIEDRQPASEWLPRPPAALLESLQLGTQLLQPNSPVRALDNIHHDPPNGFVYCSIFVLLAVQSQAFPYRPSKRGFSLARKALIPAR